MASSAENGAEMMAEMTPVEKVVSFLPDSGRAAAAAAAGAAAAKAKPAAAKSTQSRKGKWLVVDAAGHAISMEVSKLKVSHELGLALRDWRWVQHPACMPWLPACLPMMWSCLLCALCGPDAWRSVLVCGRVTRIRGLRLLPPAQAAGPLAGHQLPLCHPGA